MRSGKLSTPFRGKSWACSQFWPKVDGFSWAQTTCFFFCFNSQLVRFRLFEVMFVLSVFFAISLVCSFCLIRKCIYCNIHPTNALSLESNSNRCEKCLSCCDESTFRTIQVNQNPFVFSLSVFLPFLFVLSFLRSQFNTHIHTLPCDDRLLVKNKKNKGKSFDSFDEPTNI